MYASEGIRTAQYADRRPQIIIAGILQTLLGLFALLMTGAMVFMMIALDDFQRDGMPQTSPGALVPGTLIYALGAIWFVSMGVGSLLLLRWARDLSLAACWLWLVFGIAGFAAVLLMGPGAMAAAIPDSPPDAPPMGMIFYFTLGILAVVYLLLPGGLLALYSGPAVKATFEAKDPQPRWTSRCPIPVLAVVLLFTFSGLTMWQMGAYNWTMPVFGITVTGAAGAAVVLCISAGMLALAYGYFRLRPWAWGVSLVWVCLGGASMVISFSMMDLRELYSTMGMPQEQVDITLRVMSGSETLFTGLTIIVCLLSFGYLFALRRYFRPTGEGEASESGR